MEREILIFLLMLTLLVLALFWYSFRQWRQMRATHEKEAVYLLMQQQIDSLRDQVGRSLEGNVQIIHQQLATLSQQVISHLNSLTSQVNEQLGTGMGLVQKSQSTF